MKILLVNPYTGKISMTPPLGLRYISAMLKANGFSDIMGVDLHVDPPSRFESEAKKADVVGFSTVSKIFPKVVTLAKRAKELNPKIKVVLGGPHPTLCPEEVISADPIDFVVVGEGEYTFLELIKALEGNVDFSSIKGIWYKNNGIIKQNPPRGFIKNLDELPFPDFELFDINKYVPRSRRLLLKPVTIIASRSCPFNCTSCQPALREIMGSYRQRSVENVISEIKFLMENYGIRVFSFIDNTFTVNRKWVIDFCNEIINQKLGIMWDCSGAAIRTMDKDLMKIMKKSGCRIFGFGVESGSQYVLDNILDKKHTVERSREVVREANELGFITHCWFMIGIPGETKEQLWETVELAKTIGADSVMFSVVAPQPHIALVKTCKEKGWIIPHDLSDLEKPGFYSFSLFKEDEWLGRSSLFRTDEWGPEYIEEVKAKIMDDFKKIGWSRQGFMFINTRKSAEQRFLRFIGNEAINFLTDFDFVHIKRALKAIKYKTMYLLGKNI